MSLFNRLLQRVREARHIARVNHELSRFVSLSGDSRPHRGESPHPRGAKAASVR